MATSVPEQTQHNTTQQSGQTADKEVEMGYCIAYSSVNTGVLSVNLKSDRGSRLVNPARNC